jgi:hypothetical protein
MSVKLEGNQMNNIFIKILALIDWFKDVTPMVVDRTEKAEKHLKLAKESFDKAAKDSEAAIKTIEDTVLALGTRLGLEADKKVIATDKLSKLKSL